MPTAPAEGEFICALAKWMISPIVFDTEHT